MRVHDLGSSFRVLYSDVDAYDFSDEWPGSHVRGSGSFEFDKNGDLIDTTGSASEGDGSDWLAFSEDCQKYGKATLAKRRKKSPKRVANPRKRKAKKAPKRTAAQRSASARKGARTRKANARKGRR